MSGHNNPVAIFGARRGVGLACARHFRAQGHPVVALLRPGGEDQALRSLGVEVVVGNAENTLDVLQVFDRHPSPWVVISTLSGPSHADGRYPDETAQNTVTDVAKLYAIKRYILFTAIGCGDMWPFASEAARQAFGPMVQAKTKAEDYLRASGIPHTIIRPGGLRDDPATGRAILSLDPDMHGFVQRADCALLAQRVLDDPRTLGQAYAAVDADQARCPNGVVDFADDTPAPSASLA